MSIFSKTALTILFLATQHVALSKHLSSKDLSKKKSNMHDTSPKEDVSRELWEKCYFQGSSYQPGHWLQGPTHTCLCSDSGSWVSCKENPKPCPYEGSSYQPGQWLQLPDKMCKCDHDGSGEWVDCKENGWSSCAREEYLSAVNELREGIDMCNTHHNTYLFVEDCELRYRNEGTWAQTKIAGKNDHDCQLIMQRDGNIVFYDHDFGSSIWKSSTRGRNGQMYIDPHGTVYLQIPIIRLDSPSTNQWGGWRALRSMKGWNRSRNCKGSKLLPGQQLRKNEYICDEDSEAYFGINTDGNLVGASCDGCFEENPTHDDYNAHHVKMETSGKLVLYDDNWKALWDSETRGMNSILGFHEGSVFVLTEIIDEYGNDKQND